jgi:PIN domain nuclease of toxin-antitoxin system
MQVLLDTHILIWFLEGNSLLSVKRQKLLSQTQNDVYLSIASLWELAIKISIGKITLSKSLFQIIQQLGIENIEILPILPQHVLQIETMPFHHRDPFDRIIIAQGYVENLTILSDDTEFVNYSVKLA